MSTKRAYGYLKDPFDSRDLKLSEPPVLPPMSALIDWHAPIFDQMALGSCVANSVCAILADLDFRDDGKFRNYSRLYLYARTRQAMKVPLTDDSGLYIRTAVKTAQNDGICIESLWPYGNGVNSFKFDPPSQCDVDAERHQIFFYYRLPSLKTIKMSIAMGWPVVIGFDVPISIDDEETTQTGKILFPDTRGIDGGHAITLIGFDDDIPMGKNHGALYFANSWGRRWGVGGYGWLDYEYIKHNMADDAWTVRGMEA